MQWFSGVVPGADVWLRPVGKVSGKARFRDAGESNLREYATIDMLCQKKVRPMFKGAFRKAGC